MEVHPAQGLPIPLATTAAWVIPLEVKYPRSNHTQYLQGGFSSNYYTLIPFLFKNTHLNQIQFSTAAREGKTFRQKFLDALGSSLG
jgi:hypothetical protein